jgi:hypothetical protein
MQPEPFPNHKITETGENLSRGVHFFRSLLGKTWLNCGFKITPDLVTRLVFEHNESPKCGEKFSHVS